MKISKELKTGVITVAAIGLLVAGVNFLKGNSFFGGDDHYYAYFADAGQLSPASAVNLNGVTVGRVQSVIYEGGSDSTRLVKVSFNIKKIILKCQLALLLKLRH